MNLLIFIANPFMFQNHVSQKFYKSRFSFWQQNTSQFKNSKKFRVFCLLTTLNFENFVTKSFTFEESQLFQNSKMLFSIFVNKILLKSRILTYYAFLLFLTTWSFQIFKTKLFIFQESQIFFFLTVSISYFIWTTKNYTIQ